MTRFPLLPLLLLALSTVPARARAQAPVHLPGAAERQEQFGGAVAPAVLPDGGMSWYGFVGAPELAAGVRSGHSLFELEGRARLDYFRISLALEGLVRARVYERGPLSVAPSLGAGLVLDAGATYLDEDNFDAVFARVTPGLVASYRLSETVYALGLVDLPLDLGLSPGGARRFQALGGGGIEAYLGEDVSLLVAGQLGVDALRERPAEDWTTRLGYTLRLGVGFRLF
ncbi:hypothetical protein FGE12_09180 [Aggregicoccus sp. 17bor-14]|uniref:hypothetical protein n=1 Tax=Myxococcaceae TaxID=31 RepID=UPI00129C74A4|nr:MULTISPECIES: hypothetical protein [Myxococcaceae]MBF5042571.1 hypothetical protein [Simulacricoccus sp. 17bor-14]MRI88340.1 hypothetical protein [Aggregicoccus sp. 17bor-14]